MPAWRRRAAQSTIRPNARFAIDLEGNNMEPSFMTRTQVSPDPSFERARLAVLSAAILIAAGCTTSVLAPPDVPAAVRAPVDQEAFLEALASGVQIYACAAKSNPPAGFEWVLRAPEAALVDRSGHAIGKHYAGPTWESVDGSTVVGDVKGRDPGPDPSAIPWLLLTVKSSTGAGVLTQTKSIQRLKTVGGVAPSQACGATNVGEIARMPYTATYYFYRVTP
jgi:hypothetical protein